MTDLTDRLDKTRIDAGFSYTDMARWLGVPWATSYTWCTGQRAPATHSVPLIEERLGWLDDEIKKAKNLPLPLALRQYDRAATVDKLRAVYEQRRRRV